MPHVAWYEGRGGRGGPIGTTRATASTDPLRPNHCPDTPIELVEGEVPTALATATCQIYVNGTGYGPAGSGDTFELEFTAPAEDSWRADNCTFGIAGVIDQGAGLDPHPGAGDGGSGAVLSPPPSF